MELASMMEQVLNYPPQAVGVLDVLAGIMGVAPHSADLVEIIAVVNRRFAALDEMAEHLADETFSESQREYARRSCQQLRRAFDLTSLTSSWPDFRQTIPRDAVVGLEFFSHIVRRHRPLKLVTDEERDDILNELVVIKADLIASNELVGWQRQALIDGLRQLELKLRHLRFFGVEDASGNLLIVGRLVEAALEEVSPFSSESEAIIVERRPVSRRLASLVQKAAFVMAVFVAPSEIHTAIGWYRDNFFTGNSFQGLPAPQKQLPAPEVGIGPRREEEVGAS